MIDARTVGLLQEVLRRESRSLLQYVRDAYPWTTAKEREPLARLRQLTDEEGEGAAALSDFLRRHRATPGYLGPYPMSYTRLNFVSLGRLLPLIVEEQRRGVAHLDKNMADVQGEARTAIQAVLDRKRRHLGALEALAAQDTTPGTLV